MKSSILRAMELGSILFGLVLVGSCTTMGTGEGIAGAAGGLLLGLVVGAIIVGFVFLITRTHEDVHAIRKQLEARSTAAGAPESRQGREESR